ncbi:MAG: hypothetical protein IPM36_14845 [Lewinellaceae bacterium]|nr:hypothetical protein [Lewinellaceae bacterium]
MLKQITFTIVLASAILLPTGCKKETPCGPVAKGNPIQFDRMEVGQSSRYLGLLGEKYFQSSTNDFVYTDDTLVLTIVGKEAKGFRVAEEVRYKGDVDNWMAPEKDSTYHYFLDIKDDTLKIYPDGSDYLKSRLFHYAAGTTGLSLAPVADPKIQISGWKTDLSYCECFRNGYAVDYSLFNLEYDRLNVVIDNRSMAFDANGETYVYAGKYGIVRASTYGWWTSMGYGWDLLPVAE